MIDVGLKKYVGITSWMALHRRPRFGLCLAGNASNASLWKALRRIKIVLEKNVCSAHRLISGPLLYRTGLVLNLGKIM